MRACRSATLAAAGAVAGAAVAAAAALAAPFPLSVELGSPTAYLSIYIHVPLAWASYLLFFAAAAAGLGYLTWRRERLDRLTYYSALAGEAFGVAALATGMAWASESWGAPWSWDPRQTGVLLLLLAYLGYFAVRSSITDPERRRAASAAYAVAAFAMVPLSFAAALAFESLHPTPRQTSGFLSSPGVAPFFAASVLAATAASLSLVKAMADASEGRCSLRPLRPAALAVIAITLAAAAVVAAPYATGDPTRVLDAGLEGGGIAWIETEAGRVEFGEPVESPVEPAVTQEGRPSIIGHLVLVGDGGVEVVKHWSVALNLAVYGATLGGLMLAAPRLARPPEGEEEGVGEVGG